MKTIFLSFSISNSSLTEYFLVTCNTLAKHYRVVVITDRLDVHPFDVSPELIILKWPSARPTTLKAFWFLVRMVLKYRPATMIAMFGSMNVFILAGWLLRVRNRIAWNRSIYAKTAADAGRDKRKSLIYKMATHVFANSNATRRDMLNHFSVPDHKITVLYNAVRNVPHDIVPNPKQLVFVGRFHPLKGLDTLLAAMPRVIAEIPEVKLVLVGAKTDGQLAESYRIKARELGILGHIEFAGVKNKQDITQVLASSACCVVPSFLEAFGFVVIESFSVRTPVVGSDSSGIAEVIRHGHDGLLFPPGDSEALARQLIIMLSDESFREACASSCHARFSAVFELEKVTNDVVAELQKITG